MKHLFVLLLALLVTACVSHPPAPILPAAQRFAAYQQQVASWQQWQARGKWAIRQGKQKGSSHFNWRHQAPDNDTLVLSTFIGITIFRAEQRPGFAHLEADDKTLTGTQLGPLLYHMTGWDLPVTALRNWLQGVPYAKQAKLEFNSAGQLIRITEPGQDGHWVINYQRPSVQDDKPRQITVRYRDLWLKLAISDWDIGT